MSSMSYEKFEDQITQRGRVSLQEVSDFSKELGMTDWGELENALNLFKEAYVSKWVLFQEINETVNYTGEDIDMARHENIAFGWIHWKAQTIIKKYTDIDINELGYEWSVADGTVEIPDEEFEIQLIQALNSLSCRDKREVFSNGCVQVFLQEAEITSEKIEAAKPSTYGQEMYS